MNKENARTSCCSIGDGLCVWGVKRNKSVRLRHDRNSRLTYAYLQVSRSECCLRTEGKAPTYSLPSSTSQGSMTHACYSILSAVGLSFGNRGGKCGVVTRCQRLRCSNGDCGAGAGKRRRWRRGSYEMLQP
jgi:hypothetical protein